MDYSELNLSSWSSYLDRFKDLLRPEGLSPLGEPDENVESARAQDSARMSIGVLSGRLPNLVFDGYRDWYGYDDEWVLRNLGQVLIPEEEDEILGRLDQGTPEALGQLLEYLAGQRLSVWETTALDEFARPGGEGSPGLLTGLPNTANWEASRTPGTYYYTYTEGRYLYSDLAEGPVSEWETLPEREELATANASFWGDSGWYCTPAGEPGLYGGSYVYAPGSEGPWMTEDRASAQIEADAVPDRYNRIEPVPGQYGWLRGYDTRTGAWKFTMGSLDDIPGDEAWTAVNEYSADGTMYFAGPGYSDDGWLAFETEPGELAESPATAEEVAADARQVRAEVVQPAIAEMLAAHPGMSEAQAARLIAAATSRALQGAGPTGR